MSGAHRGAWGGHDRRNCAWGLRGIVARIHFSYRLAADAEDENSQIPREILSFSSALRCLTEYQIGAGRGLAVLRPQTAVRRSSGQPPQVGRPLRAFRRPP